MLLCVALQNIMLFYATWRCITLHHVASRYILHYITLYNITPCYITSNQSNYITLEHATSNYITVGYIRAHSNTLHKISLYSTTRYTYNVYFMIYTTLWQLHDVTLHYTTSHQIRLHSITSNFITCIVWNMSLYIRHKDYKRIFNFCD